MHFIYKQMNLVAIAWLERYLMSHVIQHYQTLRSLSFTLFLFLMLQPFAVSGFFSLLFQTKTNVVHFSSSLSNGSFFVDYTNECVGFYDGISCHRVVLEIGKVANNKQRVKWKFMRLTCKTFYQPNAILSNTNSNISSKMFFFLSSLFYSLCVCLLFLSCYSMNLPTLKVYTRLVLKMKVSKLTKRNNVRCIVYTENCVRENLTHLANISFFPQSPPFIALCVLHLLVPKTLQNSYKRICKCELSLLFWAVY